MWRGLADMPFPEYVTYCREAGAEVRLQQAAHGNGEWQCQHDRDRVGPQYQSGSGADSLQALKERIHT